MAPEGLCCSTIPLFHTTTIAVIQRSNKTLAGTTVTRMSTKRGQTANSKLYVIIPVDLHARIDEARAQLLRLGIKVSYSSLTEVALEELLSQRDLASILRRRGASARRH